MRSFVSRSAALLILLALSVAPALADSATDGAVSGTVSNGTPGASTPAGDTVYLLVFSAQQQAPVDQKSTPVGPDGNFHFTGLSRNPDLVYYALTKHSGVSYAHPQPFRLSDSAQQQADIVVYETTATDDSLQFARLNVLITSADPGTLHGMEMGSIVNAGDRTFVPPDPQEGVLAHAVRFGLPKGTLNASLQSGFNNQDVLPSVSGIQVNSPVTPGAHDFALSFDVPYTGSSADLTFQDPYSTGAFTLYLPDIGASLEGDGLSLRDRAQMGGQTYAQYAASNLTRDAMLNMHVSHLPSPDGDGFTPNQLALMSLGAVVLILGAGALILSFRSPAAAGTTPSFSKQPQDEQERLQLILRLAALDENFEEGAITRENYEQERALGKQRLLQLTRAQQTG